MLTFTHTYLLNRAYQSVHNQDLSPENNDLILGNLIPDFITHLGRADYQALAHNLEPFISARQRSHLIWGIMFHIFCDNFSTLGQIIFAGSYNDFTRNGFIEKLAPNVVLTLPLHVPKRRILQCTLDILVLRKAKTSLVSLLQDTAAYLQREIKRISSQVASIYQLNHHFLPQSLLRFSEVYGPEFIDIAATEPFRAFPLVRSLLNLSSMTAPAVIFEKIRANPELLTLIEMNLPLLQDQWQSYLDQTIEAVMKFPGMKAALMGNF